MSERQTGLLRGSGALRWPAVVLALALPLPIEAEEIRVKERIGHAYDRESGEFLYTEVHRERFRSGEIVGDTVLYRDEDGNRFAVKRIDFTRSAYMPDFALENPENGHREGARESGGMLTVHFREIDDTTLERTRLELPSTGIIDAGFDRFIESNWDALVQGKAFVQKFLIPSRLGFYDFEIRRDRQSETGPEEVVFILESRSLLVRLFVAPVVVTYDAGTRSLVRYEGLSNMRDGQGNNYDARIEFPSQQASAETGGSIVDVRLETNDDSGIDPLRAAP